MMKLPFRRRHSYHAVLFLPGLLSFFVYYLTLAPGLQVADAGEQITAAHFLGISHPPGTPLYLMVLKVWELLFPFGAIAWRMNLFKCPSSGSVAVTLTGYLFFQLCLFFGASKSRALTLAAALSLIFAYSRTYSYESVAASSYLLHYLFVVVWLKEMTKLVMRQSDDRLYRLYLVTGFALANHILYSHPAGGDVVVLRVPVDKKEDQGSTMGGGQSISSARTPFLPLYPPAGGNPSPCPELGYP